MTKDQFIKYLQGNCTEAEFEQVLHWIREGSQSTAGHQLAEELWDEFEPEAETVENSKYNRILDKIHHQINLDQQAQPLVVAKVTQRNRILSLMTRAAAILLLPVLSLLLYTTLWDQSQFAANTNEVEMEAPAGSRMNFVLGDGTRVWLNHGGKLRYPFRFDGKIRKVFLTGEAYFMVAHNHKVPFVVEARGLEVKATGTEFNVSAYPEDDQVETTLVEGKVLVYEKNQAAQIKELYPNQCFKYNGQNKESVLESGNVEKYIAWKNGVLLFKNDHLADIAKKLAKWYNVDVEMTTQKNNGYTYTATFTDETLPQVLELMTLVSPVSFTLRPREKTADGQFTKQKIIIGLKTH
ncbi:MAG TPA: FecR family protein [Prolixibacteraceae bacterium]